ncbi:hypothetical protein MC7420_6089 [Coleofasciculus chthonoplastes PCC 7420]|uniref:Uncharacterized protein n=1 Tax=Coleofasciculus chthonoplastes PCC 7420 TaxID=118168 RepID=B4VTG5_9CYAN|nr:hypothetical protein MC7420_6089 [Coleofasciculus chthonoplastes PCC 7420]
MLFYSKFISKLFNQQKPQLTSLLKLKLLELYKNDIDSLSRLIGENLENWKK